VSDGQVSLVVGLQLVKVCAEANRAATRAAAAPDRIEERIVSVSVSTTRV